jgi:hypothetical protein
MTPPEQALSSSKDPIDRIRSLMDHVLLPTPRTWYLAVCIAVLLSLFQISRTPAGAVDIQFSMGTLSAVLIALVWLPFLLKVVALGGGSLKIPQAETTLPGLWDLLSRLDPETQLQVLPSYIKSVEAAEATADPAERAELRHLRRDLEDRLGELVSQGQLYEKIRLSLPSGPERTAAMTGIVTEAQTLARQGEVPLSKLIDLFSAGDGGRIAALAVVKTRPSAEHLTLALNGVANSRSAFEKYLALRALEELLPRLTPDQQRQVAAVLDEERSGGPDHYITPDSDRWPVSQRILDFIDRSTERAAERATRAMSLSA